jgi:hypothetical protein
MNKFLKGVITGAASILFLVILVLVFRFFYERDRKIYEYMEAQREIQTMQEDIGNRPLDEFLDDPGVRGAADNADAEFRRKRDERYSEYEVDCLAKLDLLIEDLTGAAHEAVEQAAAEAARAAALASLERESAAILEAQRLQGENSRLKKSRVKTAVVTGVVCFFGGLAVGVGGVLIIGGR